MNKIKSPAVAGMFYSADKTELESQIKAFIEESNQYYDVKTRAVIVPHAGHVYSGKLAVEGLSYLAPAKNIFIFAPAHRVAFKGLALSSYNAWETPLGEIELNNEICKELKEKFDCDFFNEAFAEEHSIEVQIPFIQTLFKNTKIIPVLVGAADFNNITNIIDYYWKDKDNVFVISSDLSHFYRDDEAKKIDELTAEMIEEKQFDGFNNAQACGHCGVLGLANFAKSKEFSLIRVGMMNSGDITGDRSSVVGYGSWLLAEESVPEFIKNHFSQEVIKSVKLAIMAVFGKRKTMQMPNLPPVFSQQGACFVTLNINGNLRGCIGSIIAQRSYIEDITANAQNAAFKDPRFSPLTIEEFSNLEIDVSLLSQPVKIEFEDEEDLLSKIVPFKDGIIIKDGLYQAVYLPSVWEQLPEKCMFLASLKIKAGMTPEHFSKTFEAYRFYTEMVK